MLEPPFTSRHVATERLPTAATQVTKRPERTRRTPMHTPREKNADQQPGSMPAWRIPAYRPSRFRMERGSRVVIPKNGPSSRLSRTSFMERVSQ